MRSRFNLVTASRISSGASGLANGRLAANDLEGFRAEGVVTVLVDLDALIGVFLAGFIEIRIPQEIGKIASIQAFTSVVVVKIRHGCHR